MTPSKSMPKKSNHDFKEKYTNVRVNCEDTGRFFSSSNIKEVTVLGVCIILFLEFLFLTVFTFFGRFRRERGQNCKYCNFLNIRARKTLKTVLEISDQT